MSDRADEVSTTVTTGFGYRSRESYVQILIEAADWMTQMPPATARELAANLWEAAEAADGDGFLMSFVAKVIGIDEQRAQAALLVHFSEYRDEQRKKGLSDDQ